MASETAQLRIEIDANTRELNRLESRLNDINNQAKNIGNTGTQSFGKMAMGAAKFAGSLYLVSKGIDAIYQGLQKSVTTFAEFQKYRSTLENAFGDRSTANQAMVQIQKFAQSMPYDVKTLTASYIKLLNRGVKPTTKELTKMGDLAASQGKSMDQWVEAVLDGMSGQNERLLEFGIKSEDMGDKVAFTFRGVTKEVEKTEDAIKDALIAFGDVKGIAGAGLAVAVTLEGQYNNLGDNLDDLYNLIGDILEPTLISLITEINSWINWMKGDKGQAYKIEQYLKNLSDLQTKVSAVGSGETENEKSLYRDLIKNFPSLGEDITEKMFGTDAFTKQFNENFEELKGSARTTSFTAFSTKGDELQSELDEAAGVKAAGEAAIMNRTSAGVDALGQAGYNVLAREVTEMAITKGNVAAYKRLEEILKDKDMESVWDGLKDYLAPGWLSEYMVSVNDVETKQNEILENKEKQKKAYEVLTKQFGKGGNDEIKDALKVLGFGTPADDFVRKEKGEGGEGKSAAEGMSGSGISSKQSVYTIQVENMVNIEELDTVNKEETLKLIEDMSAQSLNRLLRDTQQN